MAAIAMALSLLLFAFIPALLATKLSPAGGLRQRGNESGSGRALVRSDFGPDMNSQAEDVRLTAELRRRIEALPEVAGTTVALRVPFGLSGAGRTHKLFLPQNPGTGNEGVTVNYDSVADRYFEVMGTRILRGRAIDRHDVETQAHVLVVNQQMAARLWPNQDAVGQRLHLERADGEEYEVIGVVESGKYNDIQEDTMAYFFVPMSPQDYGEVEMAVKTRSDPAAVATPFRQTLRELNPNAAIVELVTMREHMRQALYEQQVNSRLISTLGLLGLALAAVGIYGLMAFVAGKRKHEIGVRLALGSQRNAIFRLMVRYALQLTLIGTVIGLAGAWAAGHYLRSLLVGVAPTDVLVFFIAITVLLAIAFVAGLMPALAATRVDPIIALRDE